MMTTNALITISSREEGDIDRDRIVDGHLVSDEFFCPICQYLLWKPSSCSFCQHLFCEKCIRTWFQNPNSGNKCPFRCEPFEDRRCPPYFQSLLSRLNVHCRNSLFGCTQILPYEKLEHHENVECHYLSLRCLECDKLVLLSKFVEHQQIGGLCIPYPIKCTICQNNIEKCVFREHFDECCQNGINLLNTIVSLNENVQRILNGQPIARNNGLTFFERVRNTIQLFERQREMSQLPTTLKGIDEVRRGREQNCGHFNHILILFKFLLLNWSKIPFFIITLLIGSLFGVGIVIIGGYLILSDCICRHISFGSFFLVLLTYLLSYGICFSCQLVSDPTIFLSFLMFMFSFGSSIQVPLEVLETNGLFNRPILSTIFCCIWIFVMKVILLLIRLYYWFLSENVVSGLLIFTSFYLVLKAYRANSNRIIRRTNRLNMPV